MSSAAHAVATFLSQQSIAAFAVSTGWRLSIGNEPMDPPNCVTVYDTGGDEFDTDQLDITTFSVQVRVRAVEYSDACVKAKEISKALRRASFTHDDVRYISVKQMGGLQHIGFNDQNRALLTMNFDCLIQENE